MFIVPIIPVSRNLD